MEYENKHIGTMIENAIISELNNTEIYKKVEKVDKDYCDVVLIDKNDRVIFMEIKSTKMITKNGFYHNGERFVRGRFYIRNQSHKKLVEVKGLYIFALYDIIDKGVFIFGTEIVLAKKIKLSHNKNTKIVWSDIIKDLSLPEYVGEVE